MRKVCCIVLFLLLAVTDKAFAVTDKTPTGTEKAVNRIPRKTLLYGVGLANQYDSYLSPTEFSGVQLDLLYGRERILKTKPHASFQSLLNMQFHTTTPQDKAPRMYGGDVHYDAGWFYNWWNVGTPRLSLRLGGQIGTTLGGLYCNRASNNPANAHATFRTSASFGAQYVIPLRRTQLALRYQADLPILGAAFSPDYGQSYYELSEHGYYHNICFTSLHNAYSMRQLALLDIRLRRSTLTFGYKADIRQAKLNNLRQHQYGHSFMIGWSRWL